MVIGKMKNNCEMHLRIAVTDDDDDEEKGGYWRLCFNVLFIFYVLFIALFFSFKARGI